MCVAPATTGPKFIYLDINPVKRNLANTQTLHYKLIVHINSL